MNAPAVVDSRTIRDSILEDGSFRAIREIWNDIDVAILSVSQIDEHTSMYRSGVFDAADLSSFIQAGGVCATNFTVLDADGRETDVPIAERVVNLPFYRLREIPHVIVVAAGEQKTEALRAVLASGVVNRLITDADCGGALVV
jgi:DNA-binding transcriptional regulator LsrR (DeoR family)